VHRLVVNACLIGRVASFIWSASVETANKACLRIWLGRAEASDLLFSVSSSFSLPNNPANLLFARQSTQVNGWGFGTVLGSSRDHPASPRDLDSLASESERNPSSPKSCLAEDRQPLSGLTLDAVFKRGQIRPHTNALTQAIQPDALTVVQKHAVDVGGRVWTSIVLFRYPSMLW